MESGYDDEFREPLVVVSAEAGSERGTSTRVESLVQLHAQVEPVDVERLAAGMTGPTPDNALTLCLHYKELEDEGLVGSDGRPLLKIGDRLAALRDPRTKELVETFRNPPGMFAIAVRPGWGWLGRKRNLLLITFADRELSRAS